MNFFKRFLLGMKNLPEKPKLLTLPKGWMSPANMTTIKLHWTAGTNIASALDKEHYHFLIQFKNGKAEIVRGSHAVWDNVPPLREGNYAAHTFRANSFAIGVSICGMHEANDRTLDAGDYPITKGQWDLAVQLIATLANEYGIKPDPREIMTHAEVQKNLKIRQKNKWDIAFLPFWKKEFNPEAVGNRLRSEVAAYL